MMWLIPYLGDFHLLFNTQPIIMKLYWAGGLHDLAKKTHSGSSLQGLGRCQHFRRTHIFLLHTWEAIQRAVYHLFLQQRTLSNTFPYTTEEIDEFIEACLVLLKGKKDRDFENVHRDGFLEAQQEMLANLDGLEEEYSLFCKEMCEKSKTFRYWINFLRDMKPYIGMYIANRLGAWNLRMASLKLLIPLFHAFDRPIYSRILPWHLYHMHTLPTDILQHFQHGGFVVSQTGKEGNQLMLDEALKC